MTTERTVGERGQTNNTNSGFAFRVNSSEIAARLGGVGTVDGTGGGDAGVRELNLQPADWRRQAGAEGPAGGLTRRCASWTCTFQSS